MQMHTFIASKSYSMPLNLETTRDSKFQSSPFDKLIIGPVPLEDHLELQKVSQEVRQGMSASPLCFQTSPVLTAIHPSSSFSLITVAPRKAQTNRHSL